MEFDRGRRRLDRLHFCAWQRHAADRYIVDELYVEDRMQLQPIERDAVLTVQIVEEAYSRYSRMNDPLRKSDARTESLLEGPASVRNGAAPGTGSHDERRVGDFGYHGSTLSGIGRRIFRLQVVMVPEHKVDIVVVGVDTISEDICVDRKYFTFRIAVTVDLS